MIAIFYTAIHILGIICLLPLSRKIPVWFISSTGFIWGILLWGACSLISALIGLPFTLWAVMLLVMPVIATSLYFLIIKKTYKLGNIGWIMIGTSTVIIAGLALALTKTSYVYATSDSFNYIYHGKILANSGMVPWAINNFTKLGAFSSVLQMTSAILPGQYLSGYQTILGVNLLAVLFVSMTTQAKRALPIVWAMTLSGTLILTMMSTIFLEQLFYIHNNLPAALLLFLAIYLFWQYYQSDEPAWLFLGLIAITGFSFTRIEGPLYVIAFLVLIISIKPQPYRRILLLVLPYTAVTGAWHGFLYTNAAQNKQLSQTNLLLIISAIIGLAALALLSKWLSPLMPLIPRALIFILFGALILSVVLEPDHMVQSITHFWQNLLNVYFWGWSWIAAIIVIPLLLTNQKTQESRLLLFVITAYILIVLLLALARIPYRLGKTDSANRLMFQILPLCYFALSSCAQKIRDILSPAEAISSHTK